MTPARSEKVRFPVRRVNSWLLTLLSVAGLWTATWPQTSTTGILRGVVTDPSGRVVLGAHVRVTNEKTTEARTVETGEEGSFTVPLLPPGLYRIDVGANGFARATVSSVSVTITETNVTNVTLRVGSEPTTVDVRGTPPLVEASSTALGDVVNNEQVENLPLVNRNFTQIMTLSAGVVASVTDATELGRGSGGQIPTTEGLGQNVNGARASDINFQIDGIDVNDYDAGGLGVPIPNPDMIEEFKVQTGMYDAEYGRDAGAVVSLVTKTGSNRFHGNLFEFWRNDVLNANDFFLNQNGVPRPELKQNQFGGTLGGPIIKNRVLFFGAYQGTRQMNGVSGRQTFFSPLTTNDRSPASIGSIFSGQRGLQYIFGPPGFGPAISADGSNINGVALKLLQFKLANGQYLFPTANPANDLVSLSVPATFDENQYMANLDFLESPSNTIQGRFFTARSNTTSPFSGGGNLPGAPSTITTNYLFTSVNDTYILQPNLFNEVRAGYDRILSVTTPHSPFRFSDIGVTSSAQNDNKPSVTIAGSDNFNPGFYFPIAQDLFNLEDHLAWVHRRHSFRFGGALTRTYVVNSGEQVYGQVNFSSWPDFLLGMNGAQNGTAGLPSVPPNGFSDVLYSFDLLGVLAAHPRVWEISAYGQDDWQLFADLTLNLGLRWEWLPPFTDLNGRATNVNPALVDPNPSSSGTLAGYVVPANWIYPVPAGVVKSGITSFIPGSGTPTWDPRIGFAYILPSSHGRAVVRGGYGIYYSAITGNSQFQSIPNLPWALIRTFVPPFNGGASWAHPFQEPIPPLSQFPFFAAYTPTSDLSSIATQQTLRPAITQQYAFNVQTAITPTLALQLGYVGSNSNHLIYSHSINQAGIATAQNPIRGETTNTLSNLSMRVPYQGWDPAGFEEQSSEGRSNFNALEVTLKKNLSHGLEFLSAYTWSKTLSTGAANVVGSTFGEGTYGDQNNLYAGYGEANFSRRDRLIVSAIYGLPRVRHGSGVTGKTLSGWALTTVVTVQSGTSLAFLNINSSNLFGTSNDFAYLDPSAAGCDGRIGREGSVEGRLNQYFNTACFSSPPVTSSDGGTAFGNTRPGLLRGPAQHNVDLAMRKTMALKQSVALEFRAEFFNAFNSAQFGNPDTTFSDGPSAFGRITSTSVAPRVGQLGLKLNF